MKATDEELAAFVLKQVREFEEFTDKIYKEAAKFHTDRCEADPGLEEFCTKQYMAKYFKMYEVVSEMSERERDQFYLHTVQRSTT